MLKSYVKLMRVKQYIKNLLILLPAIFSGVIFDFEKTAFRLVLGVLCFSLMASTVYIINDIFDREKDRLDEQKLKSRPIANGTIPVTHASVLTCILLICSIGLMIYLRGFVHIILFSYLMINVLYSKVLKNIPVIELFCVGVFYLIRVLYGALLCEVEISSYMFIMVLMMSLMIVCDKRKLECKKNRNSRPVLLAYSYEFLNISSYLGCGLGIMNYIIWIYAHVNTQFDSTWMLISVLIMIILLVYFQWVCDVQAADTKLSDPVEIIYKNQIMMGLMFLYGVTVVIAYYMK